MSGILLTKSTTPIIGWVATLLGYVMEGIFNFLDLIGIPNIGLAIIIFTIVVYMFLLPLTIKQQKFSKLSNKMNPELQAIQKKYQGRKDNDSMMAMQNETQAVYAKYGVSPMGSCLQLLIQLPIIYALYQVIYAIPAYIGKVRDAFIPLVNKLIAEQGSAEFIQGFQNARQYVNRFGNEAYLAGDTTYIQNTFIDILNKASTAEWNSLAEQFPNLADDVANTAAQISSYNNFLGLNIGDSPSYILSDALAQGSVFLIIGALAIPILSALTQWINVKLMPQAASTGNDQANSMMSSMKMMNTIMPIMSAVFCFSLPAGVGLYWVASAVVRSIQQVAVNKHIDRMDFDKLIEQNKDKAKKKMDKRIKRMEKAGIDPKTINQYANMNTRKVQPAAQPKPRRSIAEKAASVSQEDREEAVKKATERYNKKAQKPGSITAKANMVRYYNEGSSKPEKKGSDKAEQK